MPIRQTDDYLTARAANPRTGLISPSCAGTPRTPDHPGHALKAIRADIHVSPTQQQQVREQFTRKLCGVGTKSTQTWLRDGSSWSQDTRALKMASPVISTAVVHADLLDASSHPGFSDDQFVVKMPCAREPQPYRFPGSSGAQIKAFEHYKHKAKRSSVEGYDQRLIELYQDDPVEPPRRRHVTQHGPIMAAQEVKRKPTAPQMHIQPDRYTMPKQRSGVVFNDPAPTYDLADVPIQSATRSSSMETNATTIRRPSQCMTDVEEMDDEKGPALPRPIPPAHRRISNESTTSTATVVTSRAPMNLGQLPRVRLIHPSLAGTPPIQHPASTTRKCSLGCDKARDGSTCSAAKRDPTPIFEPSLRSMLQDAAKEPVLVGDTPSMVHFVESIALAFTILWQVLQSGLASHEQALHRLFPQDLTLWEKLMVVKSLVLLLIKATAIFLIVAVMWKVADVAIQLLRFLLMPLRFLTGLGQK